MAGCGRDDTQAYRVGKETAQAPTQMMGQPGTMASDPSSPADAMPQLKWKLPAGWQEVPAGQMRVASFRFAGKDGKLADVSVIPLPGLAGSDLDNVNRWRGQVGLDQVSEDQLPKLAQAIEVAGQKAQIYDQAGQGPGASDKTRILAALTRRDGVAWFFKMTGDDALVAEQKPAFVEFLKSVSFSPATAPPQLPPSHPPIDGGTAQNGLMHLPPSHPAIGGAEMIPPTGAGAAPVGPAKPQWQVPADWKEASAGQFLVAKYMIGDSAQTAINVSRSVGDGGGVAPNVNRWRSQLGLTPLGDAELAQQCKPIEVQGGKGTLVDITGTDAASKGKTRLIGVIVTQSGETWFYKLMGDEQIVGQQSDAFAKFVKSAKY